MATMDIFNSDAFSQRQMLQAFESFDYLPQTVRTLGLFTPEPLRGSIAQIETRANSLSLIPTSPRGAPNEQATGEKRTMIPLETYRITKEDSIQASELLNIRAFGSESELMQVMAEINRRLLGPTGIVREIEYTWEHMMLSALQGAMVDADDSELINFFTTFGVDQATEIDFDLDNAAPAEGALRKKCEQVYRQTRRASGGSFLSSSAILGLCGDNFWDDLNAHKEVVDRRKLMVQGGFADGLSAIFGDDNVIRFGKVSFVHYWGSDDGAVGVHTDKAKFVPLGVPGLFRHIMAPGEAFAHLGAPGQAVYTEVLPDRERERHVRIIASSYPLMLCTRPAMLQRAKRT
jgi:hypothetical protein